MLQCACANKHIILKTWENNVNLIHITVRKITGSKILSRMIFGYGYKSIEDWITNHIVNEGPFPTPCVVEAFAYHLGDGWYKLDSISIPTSEI